MRRRLRHQRVYVPEVFLPSQWISNSFLKELQLNQFKINAHSNSKLDFAKNQSIFISSFEKSFVIYKFTFRTKEDLGLLPPATVILT